MEEKADTISTDTPVRKRSNVSALRRTIVSGGLVAGGSELEVNNIHQAATCYSFAEIPGKERYRGRLNAFSLGLVIVQMMTIAAYILLVDSDFVKGF